MASANSNLKKLPSLDDFVYETGNLFSGGFLHISALRELIFCNKHALKYLKCLQH